MRIKKTWSPFYRREIDRCGLRAKEGVRAGLSGFSRRVKSSNGMTNVTPKRHLYPDGSAQPYLWMLEGFQKG